MIFSTSSDKNLEKRKILVAICDMGFFMGASLLMQILTYAYRPQCLRGVSDYVIEQWFHKEPIPKSTLAKQRKKRKLSTNAGEESDEEGQPEARAVESQTEDTSADMHIAQDNVNNELSPLKTGDLHLEDQQHPGNAYRKIQL